MPSLFTSLVFTSLIFNNFLCHVTAQGEPALLYLGIRDLITGVGIQNISCELYTDYTGETENWTLLATSLTDESGYVDGPLIQDEFVVGNYRVIFYTKEYYESQNLTTFYPYVEVIFEKTVDEAYTIPVLVSPSGYSAYRGSSLA